MLTSFVEWLCSLKRFKELRKSSQDKETELREKSDSVRKDIHKHFSIDGDHRFTLDKADTRSYANSPSPSDGNTSIYRLKIRQYSMLCHITPCLYTDSGRGTSNSSRPNSQVDGSDNQKNLRSDRKTVHPEREQQSESDNKNRSGESLECVCVCST